jgi:cytochrome c oxidase subunit II
MSFDNPFGIDPNDPNGQDDIVIESNELVLLLNQPVKLLLRSKDVLHNFKVPQFRAKMDMVPGMVTYFWVTPTRPGRFEVLCAELCGVAHYAMRGYVSVVESASEYEEWLQEFPTFAQQQTAARAGGTTVAGRDHPEQGRQLAEAP